MYLDPITQQRNPGKKLPIFLLMQVLYIHLGIHVLNCPASSSVVTSIMKMWWDDSRDSGAAMGGYELFRRDR